jgi:hypothetical protein
MQRNSHRLRNRNYIAARWGRTVFSHEVSSRPITNTEDNLKLVFLITVDVVLGCINTHSEENKSTSRKNLAVMTSLNL